ncbi:MAG: hypothetical protein J5691_02580 [Bacilli bacterium]|nr:hypothetical protein [Bacilli bacterium]
MKFREWFKKHELVLLLVLLGIYALLHIAGIAGERRVYANKNYYKAKDVALYLKEYHSLPGNYMLKEDIEYFADNNIELEGKVAGGNEFENREGKLFRFGISDDRELCECDIYEEGYSATNRGTHRFVYTVDRSKVRVFETTDHYDTFREVTNFSINWFYYVVKCLSFCHFVGSALIILWVYYPKLFSKKEKVKKEDTIEAEVVDIE